MKVWEPHPKCRAGINELLWGRKFLLNKTANLLINSVGERGNWEGCQVVTEYYVLSLLQAGHEGIDYSSQTIGCEC